MAKTIKFNLICDGNPIRTIEDLQNNFAIEDVLDYYNRRLLHRWLSVRGYASELKAVSAITSHDPMEIIKKLISIFDISVEEKKVEESIYILNYLNERKKRCASYEKENYRVERIINEYVAGYRRLKNEIIENPNDVAIIKANIAEIASHYACILKYNYRNLFYVLLARSTLAVMCLLMNEKFRYYYIPVEITEDDGNVILDTAKDADKMAMFTTIRNMIRRNDFINSLGGNIISFSGMTDGYWKDLEPKGKRYMIISMGNGDYVRSAGHFGGDLSYDDIFNKFVIVNGIDYKSNSNTHKLLYMEV